MERCLNVYLPENSRTTIEDEPSRFGTIASLSIDELVGKIAIGTDVCLIIQESKISRDVSLNII